MTEKTEVILLDWWNSDRDIAETAWVSTKSGQGRPDADVKRVIENSIVPLHHQTPLECVWMKFHIRCPIFVERQFDKYRMTIQDQDCQIEYNHGEFGRWSITQNELSLRYRTMPNGYLDVPDDIKTILDKTEMGTESQINFYRTLLDEETRFYDQFVASLKKEVDEGHISHSELKRVREVYRGVLGTSFFTDMKLICNLNSFEHIINQRYSEHAQPEAAEVAKQMLLQVIENEVAPITINKMIEKNGWKL